MTVVNSSRLLAKRVLTSRFSLLPRRYIVKPTTCVLPALTLVSQGAGTTTDETIIAHWRLLAVASAAAIASLGVHQSHTTDCCGIAGVVASEQHDARYVRWFLVVDECAVIDILFCIGKN